MHSCYDFASGTRSLGGCSNSKSQITSDSQQHQDCLTMPRQADSVVPDVEKRSSKRPVQHKEAFLVPDVRLETEAVMDQLSKGLPSSSSLRLDAAHRIPKNPSWWRRHSDANNVVGAAEAVVHRLEDQICLRWLDESGKEEQSISYRAMWDRAGTIAGKLVGEYGAKKGDRVLLCYTPGVECMVSIWACLRAGVIGVPVYPPNPSKLAASLQKIKCVAATCGAQLCLVDTSVARLRTLSRIAHKWPRMGFWNTEREVVSTQGREFANHEIALDDIAYLQFTSGSTGNPKGVCCTHGNLWHQLNDVFLPMERHLLAMAGVDPAVYRNMVGVTWLPQYHDMGLVCSHMASFLAGFTVVATSPLSFLRNPLLWVQAMSKYKASRTAAPNFSYGLVAKRLAGLSDAEREGLQLDLSALLYCGDAAERVRKEVLEDFAAALRPFGFRGVHAAGYGLAEHVASVCWSLEPGGRSVSAAPPRSHLVSVGRLADSTVDIRIVDPESLQPAPDGTPGEIWLASPSVAAGYWGQEEQSAEAFDNRREGTSLRFLRTGDEGFVEDGHLFVCGRIKDVIIVRGRNFNAEDIETAVAAAAPQVVRPNCAAAFPLEAAGEEQLGVVFEVCKGKESMARAATENIIAGVAAHCDIRPSRVVAIRARSIPKTTSGKLQRKATREALYQGKLATLFDSQPGTARQPKSCCLGWPVRRPRNAAAAAREQGSETPLDVEPRSSPARSCDDSNESARWPEALRCMEASDRRVAIANRVRAEVRRVTGMRDNLLHEKQPWADAGMDSLDSIRLCNALQRRFGESLQLKSTALFDHPCLESLVDHIESSFHEQRRPYTRAEDVTIGGSVPCEVLRPVADAALQQANPCAASHQQQQMYTLQAANPEGCGYNVNLGFKLHGALKFDVLHEAVRVVMDRHASLRTSFTEAIDPGSGSTDILVMQHVASSGVLGPPLCRHNVASPEEATQLLRCAAREPFSLSTAPLFRITVCDVQHPAVYFLGLTIHHAIADGASINLLLRDITASYNSLEGGEVPPDSASAAGAPCSSYAAWQRANLLTPGRVTALEQFWKSALPTCPVLELPTDFVRPATFSGTDGIIPISIGPDLVGKLKLACARHGCTLFHALIAAYSLVLCRMSCGDEVVVGFPYANRGAAVDIDATIGNFVNTLPLLLRTHGSVRSLLDQARQAVVGAIDHAALPFAQIANAVGADRDASRPTLVQTMFSFYGRDWFHGDNSLSLGGVQAEPWWDLLDGMDARYELSVFLEETRAQSLVGGVQYCSSLYSAETACAVAKRFRQTLESMTAVSGDEEVDWLASQDKVFISTVSREQPLASLDAAETLIDMWHISVARSPSATALVTADEQVTFETLDARSDELAAELIASVGVTPGDFVGLWVEQSSAIVVGLLAILKCGGAYVPIDPDSPVTRTLDLVHDSGMVAVVCQRDVLSQAGCAIPLVLVDIAGCRTSSSPMHGPEKARPVTRWPQVRSTDLCYMIYTSGSTGKPKGCLVHHGGVAHFLRSSLPMNGLRPSDRNLMTQSYAFDASVKILWYAICSGSSVVIPRKEELLNDLPGTVSRYGCSLVSATPTFIAAHSPGALQLAGVRGLLVCGEAVSPEFVNRFAGRMRVVNGYGPTELCVNATMIECAPGMRHPRSIGPPLAGLRCYVVDPSTLRRQPRGVPGELWFSGPQVALGYHKRPDLTAQSFVANPFLGEHEHEDARQRFARIYKTGDWGRWLPDGSVEFLGRRDRQVKIRGYRVELGEVENCLQQVSAVSDSAVVVRPHTQTLAAYVVPSDVDVEACRAHLQSTLPRYMLPSTITPMDSLPRTVNNKVDFNALHAVHEAARVPSTAFDPEPAADVEVSVATGSNSAAQRRVLEVFRQVLQSPLLGAEDNLFQHGLSSLGAVRATRILREQSLADWPVTWLLQHQTVSSCFASQAPIHHSASGQSLAPAAGHRHNEQVVVDIVITPRHSKGADEADPTTQGSMPAGKAFSQHGWGVMSLQAMALVLQFSWLAACIGVPSLSMSYWALLEHGVPAAVGFGLCGLLIGAIAMVTTAIVAKWVLLGRRQPGTIPLWGGEYLRWWVVNNLITAVQACVLSFFVETFVLNAWFRALGARIGDRVSIRSLRVFDHDLVTIHDGALVDEDAVVMPHCIVPGAVVFCGVELGVCSVLSPYGHVGPSSPSQQAVVVPDRAVVAPHNTATRGMCPPPAPDGPGHVGHVFQLLTSVLVVALVVVSAAPSVALGHPTLGDRGTLSLAAFLVCAGFWMASMTYWALFVVLYRGIQYAPLDDAHRHFVVRALSRPLPFQTVFAFAFTPVVTWLLRLLGAKIGRRCQIHFPRGVVDYAALDIGDAVFAGGYLRVLQHHQATDPRHISNLQPKIHIGNHVTLTNRVVLMSGAVLHEGSTVGDMTTAGPSGQFDSGTISVGDGIRFASASIRRPQAGRYSRWEVLSAFGGVFASILSLSLIPVSATISLAACHAIASLVNDVRIKAVFIPVWDQLMSEEHAAKQPSSHLFAGVFVVVLVLMTLLVCTLAVVLFKRCCLGAISTEESTMLGSLRFRLWHMHLNLVAILEIVLADALKGSAWLGAILRLLGADVGRGASLWHSLADAVEFDLQRFDDGCALNRYCVLQGHILSSGAFQFDKTSIGPNATVHANVSLLPGSVVGAGAVVEASSLVLPGEEIKSGERWAGVPACPSGQSRGGARC